MFVRDRVVYIPYEKNSVNRYISSMIKIIGTKYEVIGGMHDFFDIPGMLRTKAVFLNWVESNLNENLKRQILLHKFWGAKIIWVMHNIFPHQNGELMKKNVSWIMDNATDIIVHSAFSIDYLPQEMRKKAVYIPHIVYDIKCGLKLKEEVKAYCGIEDDSVIFLYFGLISSYKNIEILVEAFYGIELPNAMLLIVGKPEKGNEGYISKLREYVAKDTRIKFIPREVPEDVLSGIVELSDVVVLPYQSESYLNSGTMIYALSAGKKVIAPPFAMAKDYERRGFVYIFEKDITQVLKKVIVYRESNKKSVDYIKECMKRHNSVEVVFNCITALLEDGKNGIHI